MSVMLTSAYIDTPLGKMIAIADDSALYFLDFVEGGKDQLSQFKKTVKAPIVEGHSSVIALLETELDQYFKGTLQRFTVPVAFQGTPFQTAAWDALCKIPYGQTRSYKQQAIVVGNERAFRAVAHANSLNPITIVVPCHRIINANGLLGGYRGGLDRKKWLLKHETMSLQSYE